MRIVKRICIGILLGILVFVIGCLIIIQVTPYPVSYLTRMAFDGGAEGVTYGSHPEFEQMKKLVSVDKELSYPSDYENHTYDLYAPIDASQAYPVLLWVHGGAFVGGDKKDISAFATAISAQGYVVLVMNYALAPEDQYPTPVLQVNELANELSSIAETAPMNLDEVFIGGDSAGAFIALQWTIAQINDTYRSFFSITPALPKQTIKGFLSFSGLLDLSMYDETDSSFSNFLYAQTAWAYMNTKHWKQEITAQHADVLSYFNQDVPPMYLTDGNTASFLAQAKKVKQLCEEHQIEITALLWEEGNHGHEYQFHLNQEAGLKNFTMVLEFMKRHTENGGAS